MARAARQRRENELPYIPFGPFQIRFPFIHYKIESVEFIQGLILGVTALAAVPYLEQTSYLSNCIFVSYGEVHRQTCPLTPSYHSHVPETFVLPSLD